MFVGWWVELWVDSKTLLQSCDFSMSDFSFSSSSLEAHCPTPAEPLVQLLHQPSSSPTSGMRYLQFPTHLPQPGIGDPIFLQELDERLAPDLVVQVNAVPIVVDVEAASRL
jgi:hypothetical protein